MYIVHFIHKFVGDMQSFYWIVTSQAWALS